MRKEFLDWWHATTTAEKRALLTLGAIMAGIFIFTAGIKIGAAIGKL